MSEKESSNRIVNQKIIGDDDLIGIDGETIVIGPDVSQIEEGAFAHGSHPVRILIQNNPYYQLKNSVLLDLRTQMVLSYCGSEADISIPDEAEKIGSWAFYECQPEKIIFPSHVNEIHPDAFTTCRMKEAVFAFRDAHVFFPEKDIRLRQYMLEGFGLHGMFDFFRYDESIAAGYIEPERIQELTARLKWPYQLSSDRKIQFRHILNDHLDKAVEQLGNVQDDETLHWLCDLNIIHEDNFDHVLQILHTLKDLHAWRDLSRYRNTKQNAFDFSI